MLVMLDNRSNKVETPQENFSRELMELYTCGIGHFSESDVVAMTRAWTGHLTNVSNGDDPKEYSDFAQMKETYIYEPEAHDHGRKYLFGINANWNGIAQNPSERDAIKELILGANATQLRFDLQSRYVNTFATRIPPPDSSKTSPPHSQTAAWKSPPWFDQYCFTMNFGRLNRGGRW